MGLTRRVKCPSNLMMQTFLFPIHDFKISILQLFIFAYDSNYPFLNKALNI